MKAVILAGGAGTRLSEETDVRPKPMVKIGEQPMLWHIMKHFGVYGVHDFVICLGYKGYVIKEWFTNYALNTSDVTLDLAKGTVVIDRSWTEHWRVTLLETGSTTLTGGRLKRALSGMRDESEVFVTYGDGVSDIDLNALLNFHREQGVLATVTAVQPPERFGALDIDGNLVERFREKPRGDDTWVNGGFFVLNPSVASCIEGDNTTWEDEPLNELASTGQLAAYRHNGFWHVMDTFRDKLDLQAAWDSGHRGWVTWE